MKNLTIDHLIKAQDEESLEAFVNMLKYGLDPDAIDRDEWLIGKGKNESIIISTW